ncbi:hypothetical protein [Magnetococcus sp. PR-3]|uniref:hypothetical protein n=1 Tax=Magnetococcus sp. PR-3 TaxID=3120355 RepID=UPI002FCE48F7
MSYHKKRDDFIVYPKEDFPNVPDAATMMYGTDEEVDRAWHELNPGVAKRRRPQQSLLAGQPFTPHAAPVPRRNTQKSTVDQRQQAGRAVPGPLQKSQHTSEQTPYQRKAAPPPRKMVPNSYVDLARQMRDGTFAGQDAAPQSISTANHRDTRASRLTMPIKQTQTKKPSSARELLASANAYQKKQRRMAPLLTNERDRINAILDNQPAILPIRDNPAASDTTPWYSSHGTGKRAVRLYGHIIEDEALRQGVDPNLVKAIVYSENSRGHYFGASLFAQSIGAADTHLPMNINPATWERLGITKETADDPQSNIRTGVTLIKRIIDRLRDPKPEYVGSIWNYTGREQVNDFGASVGKAYRDQIWDR